MDVFTLIGLFVILYLFIYLLVLSFADCDFGLAFAETFGQKIGVLRGKVVWITGASSGIGASLAEALAANGAKLVLSARNAGNLSKIKQKCIAAGLPATDVLILPMDMLEVHKHEQYFQQVIAHFGQLDVLVNNAGRSQRAVWENIAISVDRDIFELNVFSVISLSRLAVRYFNEKGGGHLVVMSSLAGVVGAPYSGSYTGTKHAIMGYFESLRLERMGQRGPEGQLAITLLCPGPVFSNVLSESFTDMPGQKFNQQQEPTDKRMTTQRCAKLCAIAIANRLDEAWMGLFPVVPLCYVLRYYPYLAKKLSQVMSGQYLQKIRDSRVTVKDQNKTD
ncbi:dehydrogenase/reductase SDR family member 7-like isoform X1 [Macrosteles quadrilineatus]|uniref:dehydrogenase/reductase SDR family member 7-like isoform X1 n=1 Tax=Macrosteles quadrilineatus TaxID=74068 RepID=UPI0023E31EC2|nr:dehydrogenase/reductase SDR family member 7-like isoform X1 [Macrosteles quadrilineatus]